MLRTQYHNCVVSKFWAVRLERAHFWPQLLLSVNHISFLSLLMDGMTSNDQFWLSCLVQKQLNDTSVMETAVKKTWLKMAQPSWVKILAINFIGNVGYADAVEEELSLTHLWVKHDNSCSTLLDNVRSVCIFQSKLVSVTLNCCTFIWQLSGLC